MPHHHQLSHASAPHLPFYLRNWVPASDAEDRNVGKSVAFADTLITPVAARSLVIYLPIPTLTAVFLLFHHWLSPRVAHASICVPTYPVTRSSHRLHGLSAKGQALYLAVPTLYPSTPNPDATQLGTFISNTHTHTIGHTMFNPFDRSAKTAPSHYPRLPFHAIRSIQLLSSIVVGGIMCYFIWHLTHDHWATPWTFIWVRRMNNSCLLYTSDAADE